MLEERILLSMGGLLHDIGKLYQRAYEEERKRVKEGGIFKYAHAKVSYEVIGKVLNGLKIEDRTHRLFVLSSAFHHNPLVEAADAPPELLSVRAIYRLADWYASTERSREVDEVTERKVKRLHPVFEKISLTAKEEKSWNWFYKLSPLSLSRKSLFPKIYEKLTDSSEEELGTYRLLKEGFEKALTKNFSTLSEKLSYLYYLLYKYTWCVPASVYDTENYYSHYSDISLFDHSRVVGLLSAALYTPETLDLLKEYTEGKRESYASHIRLLLAEGDVGGIQKFLYSLTNIEGVAKRLRGKSIFLSLLPEIIGRFVLQELYYPWTNFLYVGGGKFQILIGYEEGIEEKLKELSFKIEESLLKEFKGNLSFSFYFTDFRLSDIRDFRKIVKRLFSKADEVKKRKFFLTLNRYEDIVGSEGSFSLCNSCRQEGIQKGNFCSWCERFQKKGGEILKKNFLVFVQEKGDFGIRGIGGVKFLDRPNGEMEIYAINDTESLEDKESVCGFKFVERLVPTKENEEVMSFEELVELAEGDKKLAYAMADVDNLGLVFIKGLKEDYSISRIATLSRSLDLFFSGYLNTLFSEEPLRGKIYTVYAGGDDLFIVAPWNITAEAVKRVRDEFADYTCGSLGISCGVFTCSHHYPFRLAAEKTKEEEGKSKARKGKNCITILGETLRWEELEEAVKKLSNLIPEIRKEVPRTTLYKLFLLLKDYKEKENSEERYMFYPFFFYYLRRNIEKEELKKELLSLLLDNNYEVRPEAPFSIKYLLMITRNVRRE